MSDGSTAASWQEVKACTTLFQVHEALTRLRPSDGADAARWLAYRRRSAEAYERIADIDRGHHHEALYWAGRQRREAKEISAAAGLSKPDTSTRRPNKTVE